jgi:predicted Zn-ribbon and HTH transcriptional regulator
VVIAMNHMRTLPTVDVHAGAVIIDDRSCGKCGYALKGLRTGGHCPECGTAIKNIRSRKGDSLVEAPRAYLEELRLASSVMAGCVLALAVLVPILVWQVGGQGAAGVATMAGALFVVGCGWVWSVWVVTAPRRLTKATGINLSREWSGSRWSARGMIACAPVAMALTAEAAMQAPGGAATAFAKLVWTMALVCGLMTFFGLGPLAIHVSRLASWANDDGLAIRMRVAAFSLSVAGPVSIGCFAFAGAVPAISFGVATVGVLLMGSFWVGLGFLVVGMFQMASMARWALANHLKMKARDRRLKDRAEMERRAHLAGAGPGLGSVIVTERPCRACGYSLRGLKWGGRCPECGEEIG